MKNTGIEYEFLVQSVFQEIHNQEPAKNITVKRDVKLTGKSGITHQIDVFWEFEIGGIIYSTIVQAKDWKSSVKQEQILALKSVLDDLPKQPRGIIVTRKGFQRGAKKFAESHGIELFELKEVPKPPPLKVILGSFAKFNANIEEQCFETVVYPSKYKNIKLRLKESWLKRRLSKMKDLDRKAIFESVYNQSVWNQQLYNSGFTEIGTIGKLMINTMNSIQEEAVLKLEKEKQYINNLSHKFDSPTYLSTKTNFLPFIRIEGINFNVEITKDELVKTSFTKPGITTFIFQNILDGKVKRFDVKNINAI